MARRPSQTLALLVFLGPSVLVAPAEVGICETFDGAACGNGTDLATTVGGGRLSVCGF